MPKHFAMRASSVVHVKSGAMYTVPFTASGAGYVYGDRSVRVIGSTLQPWVIQSVLGGPMLLEGGGGRIETSDVEVQVNDSGVWVPCDGQLNLSDFAVSEKIDVVLGYRINVRATVLPGTYTGQQSIQWAVVPYGDLPYATGEIAITLSLKLGA